MSEIRDLMIDFETFGTGVKALPTRFAAVPFKLGEAESVAHYTQSAFNCFISMEDGSKRGFTLNDATICWWAHEQDIRNAVSGDEFKHFAMPHFLSEFHNWLGDTFGTDVKSVRVWARNMAFDVSILKSIYEACGIQYVFAYNAHRDLYTLLEAAFDSPKARSVAPWCPMKHHPVDDCIVQILNANEARAKLRFIV